MNPKPLNMRTSLMLAACAIAFGAVGSSALGQSIAVDICDDIIDVDPETATVADLPGPDGHISFSEAMIASNNTPGRQTIGFAIPTSEWTYLDWYFPGRAVVHSIGGFYWRANDEVTIDGTTQTAFTGNTNPNGGEVVLFGTAIYLNADTCTVLGLDSSSISVTASNGLVEGNTAMGIELFGGSGSVVRHNTGGYIQIDRSSNNVVVGNTVQRVRILGWIDGGQPAINNRIGGPSPADRNHIIGVGTWNNEGIPGGFAIQLFNAIGTVIENNQIGTTPDGLSQGHLATTAGILFDTENYDTLIRNNRIAGILGQAYPPHGPSYLVGTAIQIHGTGSSITIVGNAIGLNANDEPVLGSITGISTVHFFYPNGVSNVVIGGSAAGESNEIAGHLSSGISVANTYAGVRISRNSIHDNGGVGIDLVTSDFLSGVTPNDLGDADTGGNALQNFPVLTSADGTGSTTTIQGSLNSLANQAFTIEFFSSPACDPTGYGEGTMYIGATTVTTDGAGNALFTTTLPIAISSGSVVTATAIQNATGSTSEFSSCVSVKWMYDPSDINSDGVVGIADLLAVIGAWGACPTGEKPCLPDVNSDGQVGIADLLLVIGNWNGAGGAD